MLPVFKKIMILASLIFIHSSISLAHDGFHSSDFKSQIIEHFEMQDSAQRLLFEIYFLSNHGEPYVEDIKILIGYKYQSDDFQRLNRKFDNKDEQQYCSYEQPYIIDRDSLAQNMGYDPANLTEEPLLSQTGDYLVIPVYKYDPSLGRCDLENVAMEVFPIERIINDREVLDTSQDPLGTQSEVSFENFSGPQ